MANTLRRIQTVYIQFLFLFYFFIYFFFIFFYFINQKDIRGFERDKPWGIEITPHEENIRYFDATIQGPPGSPFEVLR